LVKRAEWNLIAACDGARLVLVAGPQARALELAGAVAPELAAGATLVVVTSVFSPALALTTKLPAGRSLIAARPLRNPATLLDPGASWRDAQADSLQGGHWLLAPDEDADPAAVEAVADLAALSGGRAYLMDPAEHDDAAAAAQHLPELLAVGLQITAGRFAGRREREHSAERALASAAAPTADADPGAWLANRQRVLAELDQVLDQLGRLRGQISAGDQAALEATVAEAQRLQSEWLTTVRAGSWELSATPIEVPSLGESLSRMLVGGLFKKKQ
jgi:prephenate dehydrogenase